MTLQVYIQNFKNSIFLLSIYGACFLDFSKAYLSSSFCILFYLLTLIVFQNNIFHHACVYIILCCLLLKTFMKKIVIATEKLY